MSAKELDSKRVEAVAKEMAARSGHRQAGLAWEDVIDLAKEGWREKARKFLSRLDADQELYQAAMSESYLSDSALPRIALHEDGEGELDDVVAEDVHMFRAEFMSDDELWVCCYLGGDSADQTTWERIAWMITGEDLKMHTLEKPEEYIHLDQEENNADG